MTDYLRTATMDVGVTGFDIVEAIPKTSVKLGDISLKEISEVEHDIEVGGTHVNLPQDVEGSLTFVIKYDDGRSGQVNYSGIIKVESGGSGFSFKVVDAKGAESNPKLNVFRHRLFGSGHIGCRIETDFPFCKGDEKENCIGFTNIIEVQCLHNGKELESSSLKLGTPLQLKPNLKKTLPKVKELLGNDGVLRVIIKEMDIGKDTETDKEEISWGKQDYWIPTWKKDSIKKELATSWWVGCSVADTGVIIDTDVDGSVIQQELSLAVAARPETGPYEFYWQLEVSPNGKSNSFVTIEKKEKFLTAPHPQLKEFKLTNTEECGEGLLLG